MSRADVRRLRFMRLNTNQLTNCELENVFDLAPVELMSSQSRNIYISIYLHSAVGQKVFPDTLPTRRIKRGVTKGALNARLESRIERIDSTEASTCFEIAM